MNPTPSERYPYDHHPLQAAAQLSWSDRNTSLDALHSLEAALSEPAPNRKQNWLDAVRSALNQLGAALDAQAAGDSEAASLLTEIAADEPRLLPRIERLRRDHEELRESACTLLEDTRRDGDIDIADLRERAANMARRLRQHRAREADLIYESVNINLGAGD